MNQPIEPFTTLSARAALLLLDDVDTDQIIPARFLTTTARTGLGAHLFADWRADAAGNPRTDFALNRPEWAGARILVAGRNFGCGSSREHAPWALLDYGFRAVIATSFADIFRGNALKNGLLPVAIADAEHLALVEQLWHEPARQVVIDLARQALKLPDGSSTTFPIDPFAKGCLLDGVDELGFLLAAEAEIAAYERSHASAVRTTP
ncbi:MAG: 3-isopropylmalate dehydratase small subunit [Gemmatimonadaceae bacterium]